ncbi:MAG TPA: hypothetical protein GX391_00130 [Firmicutes bacterium]|jgi:hypothetical protein|nr:hypothetical protein [Bacillota bacterium]HOQ23434.1 hypothetical protein [Bacillota bacterium]
MVKKEKRINKPVTDKTIIKYHRSYRTLPGSARSFFLHFCILALPLSAIIVLFYPWISRTLCLITQSILSPFFFQDSLRIVETPYIKAIGNVSYLSLPGRFPSTLFSLVNAIICLFALAYLPNVERAKPLVIYTIMTAAIHMVSSLFFLIFPSYFPYGASEYSRLYMLQQIGIWFFVPLIMGLGIMSLPSSFGTKCFTMGVTFLYSLVFGTLRYAVFLYILSKISLIFMAILFFSLGPLIDFVYIVGIYSTHVTQLANKLREDFTIWQW